MEVVQNQMILRAVIIVPPSDEFDVRIMCLHVVSMCIWLREIYFVKVNVPESRAAFICVFVVV